MFSCHASVTLSSIFACTVLVNIHCEIIIIYFNYLNLAVRNKINFDICFCDYILSSVQTFVLRPPLYASTVQRSDLCVEATSLCLNCPVLRPLSWGHLFMPQLSSVQTFELRPPLYASTVKRSDLCLHCLHHVPSEWKLHNSNEWNVLNKNVEHILEKLLACISSTPVGWV